MEKTGAYEKRSRNALRLAQCALMLTMVALFLGCRSESDSEEDRDLKKLIGHAAPGFITTRLQTGTVEALAPTQFFVLEDLRVGVPADWQCREAPSPGGKKALEIAGTYQEKAFQVRFRYGRRPSWIEPPSTEVLAEIGRFQDDPAGFLRGFDSDVQFLSEAFNTVPADLEGASKKEGRRLKALLLMKLLLSAGLGKVTRLELGGGTAFAYGGSKTVIAGDVCDKSGMNRGLASISFRETTDVEVAETVFWQLLAMATFCEPDAETPSSAPHAVGDP